MSDIVPERRWQCAEVGLLPDLDKPKRLTIIEESEKIVGDIIQ